jgi:3-hydroxybutyryl-CoA dehydrogenase
MKEFVACIGAGRMGRGIALVFAYAGHEVAIVDMKDRDTRGFDKLSKEALSEIRETLDTLSRIGFMEPDAIPTIFGRIRVVPFEEAAGVFGKADVVFEGLPEIVELKREAFERVSAWTSDKAIIASTTSTILVDDLSGSVRLPERFLNAHWLNPAYLVPLVELSPGQKTVSETTARLKDLLESIGKVPVVCAASPGYIVPRIQGLAMNEAARMVEEGVASAEDIDKAVIYGFGFRFAVLGLLEFIDWGGGDILYYACRYLVGALNDQRYASPPIIERNMKEGRIGIKTGMGFLNYEGLDIAAYREARLQAFANSLRALGLARAPVV